ncbi:MAG: T9SS type A sorting domain-containing protein [Bacteroidales bacterium]|nr:T9SS type A sorting domain-containing protein [Bacteroidales bacterium]
MKWFVFALFTNCYFIFSQCDTIDHQGQDWIINSQLTTGGVHKNIKVFKLETNVTLFVDSACKFLEIWADTILVYGTINGNGRGEKGGAGGLGGIKANGSGNPGKGGKAGLDGEGPGRGIKGSDGGDGNTITQICGGFLCNGNRDGLNGGGGGAGGGSGGSYGGRGGAGGFGAYGSGFSGASGGNYGPGGGLSSKYGTADNYDIQWGSGGAGGGGGGGGYSNGTNGGKGGKGGAYVLLKANKNMFINGSIQCNGSDGGNGGNGGGESTDNGYDCTSSGYNSCTLCPQAVFDAAGGAGGGAGGGSGGGVLLHSNGSLTFLGTISVNGGAGGNAGIPNDQMGNCFDFARGGAGGGGGRVKFFLNPCAANILNGQIYANGGVGGNGTAQGFSGDSGTIRKNLISPDFVQLTAGMIKGVDTFFCDYGDVPLISSVAPASGGLQTYNYQWQYSVTDSVSGFQNLPGQTGLTCDPGFIMTTTWYRRKVTSGSCVAYSNAVKFEVKNCQSVEEKNLSSIFIYPNPAHDKLHIVSQFPFKRKDRLTIYDITGKILIDESLQENQNHLLVNLQIPRGTFFLTIYTQDKLYRQILVVE